MKISGEKSMGNLEAIQRASTKTSPTIHIDIDRFYFKKNAIFGVSKFDLYIYRSINKFLCQTDK